MFKSGFNTTNRINNKNQLPLSAIECHKIKITYNGNSIYTIYIIYKCNWEKKKQPR